MAPSPSGLPRRATLTRLEASSRGTTLATRALDAAAQAAPPLVTPVLPPALQELIAGWEALDADRIARAFAEDAIFEDVATGTLRQGRETFRAHLTRLVAAFAELTFHVITVCAADDWAATEWSFSGRNTGQLADYPPGAGQQLTFRGAHLLQLADGQIQEAREYYDVYGICIQLGILPAPEVATR